MTTTPDLLSDPTNGGKPPTDTSLDNLSGDDALAMLVGEGKPYKTVADLAKSRLKADEFIETLKGETAEMRTQLQAASTSTQTNELLQTILAKLGTASTEDDDPTGQKPLTKEDIVRLVSTKVSEEQQARDKASNRIRANAELLKQFGGDATKARAFVNARAEELGVTRASLGQMAEQTPQVFLALMGAGTKSTPKASTRDGLPLSESRNGGDPLPDSVEDGVIRNYEYYKALRKKLGPRYYEPHVQQQMFRDRKALGDRYFNK